MSRPDLARLRWRLLAANLGVAAAVIVAIAAGVWLAAPGAFEDAMGGMSGSMSGGMMGTDASGMMDPLLRSAFGDAVGSAILLGLVVAAVVAVVVSLLVATRLARPIDALAAASRRVGQGDYTGRVPPGDGELGELAATFNEMAAALQASDAWRRDLIGDVAHELRTPITSIRGYVEGLEAEVFIPGPDAWRILGQQTARLEHLVDDLALLWSAESADLRIDLEALDASGVLADAAERHRPTAAARWITVEVEADGAARFIGDRTRVAQVLDNLLANALRYGRDQGMVRLVAATEPGWVRLEVADDGPGMTAEQLARAFDRFYRADPSRSRDAGGSGLGLAISRSLVRAMGGTIEATSAGPGLGTTFAVRLRSS